MSLVSCSTAFIIARFEGNLFSPEEQIDWGEYKWLQSDKTNGLC